MGNILKKFWQAEPVVAGILGNALFLPTVIYVAAALHHPLSPDAQRALLGAATLLTGGAIRQTVTAPDTLADQLHTIQQVNQ